MIEFLDLFRHTHKECSDKEKPIMCAFEGDPDEVDYKAWKPIAMDSFLSRSKFLDLDRNVYITTGLFKRAQDGTWRRRGELWTGAVALMLDDIGTKVDPQKFSGLPPTARILTSPGNEQWWWFFSEPFRDKTAMDALIRGCIDKIGKDPGMASVTRVGRVPGGLNMKAKYGGAFRCVALEIEKDRRYSMKELLEGLKIQLAHLAPRAAPRIDKATAIQASIDFDIVFNALLRFDLLKSNRSDASGWTQFRECPFSDQHSRGVTGAALHDPDANNFWQGGFKCHHGGCEHRTMKDVLNYVSELSIEILESANESCR